MEEISIPQQETIEFQGEEQLINEYKKMVLKQFPLSTSRKKFAGVVDLLYDALHNPLVQTQQQREEVIRNFIRDFETRYPKKTLDKSFVAFENFFDDQIPYVDVLKQLQKIIPNGTTVPFNEMIFSRAGEKIFINGEEINPHTRSKWMSRYLRLKKER